MANIVNTPITMYVKEHTLELDGSSATELMEYNTYPIKIYTDEDLDGCKLVKISQNEQKLIEIGEIQKDVKRLFRSKTNDQDSKKAWWVFLENLNETATIEAGDSTVTKTLYGGTLKTYKYENSLTIIPNISKRTDCEIEELGILKGYFEDDEYKSFTCVTSFEGFDFTNDGEITSNFSDLPKPLDIQLDLKIPESIILQSKLLEKPEVSFELTNDIELKNITLELFSYDEENGKYYYKANIDSTNLKNEITRKKDGKDLNIIFSGEIICKFSEEDFGDYSVEINFFITAEEEVKIEGVSEWVTYEEKSFLYTYSEKDTQVNFPNVQFEEQESDLDNILAMETADDYINVYTLKENKEYQADPYTSSGLNEIRIGLRKQTSGKTDYVTNSVGLKKTRSIESYTWYVPNNNINQCYIGQPVYDTTDSTKIIEFKQSDFDSTGNYLPKDASFIYIDSKIKNETNNIFIDEKEENGQEIYILHNLKIYKWYPGAAEFKEFSNFLIPDVNRNTDT